MVVEITSNTALILGSFIGAHVLAWFIVISIEAGIKIILDQSKG
ncbi:hypothetical protein [Sulfurovum sp.]